MVCEKKCVRITVAIVGVLLVILSLLSMYAGIEATGNPELNMLGMNKNISYTLVGSGALMLLTAGLGWTAAATKNEPLAFMVSQHQF
jgi:uncharacterized Tic20 family protein